VIYEVNDAGDPRLDPYLRMTDAEHRLHREAAEGFFIAEGRLAVRRAISNGWQPISLFGLHRFLDEFDDLVGVPRLTAGPELLRTVTGFHVHRGCLGLFARRPEPGLTDLLIGARRVLVLEGLVDHANVGAAFRSAAAFGVDAALLSPHCADPLYRRAVKVSMGATLVVPFRHAATWPEELDALAGHGLVSWAFTPGDDAVDIGRLSVPDRLALLFGTEGEGLSDAALARADVRVRIPMIAHVDSLNVAAAAAVAFFACRPSGVG
jgi:tRNA G18 (ribose-2'-O)-methylase SpoU